MNFEELKKVIGQIQGWLTLKEAITLYNFAKNCRGNGVIVEIGSWKGKSTSCLALGSKSGNKPHIYAIDPHREGEKAGTLEEFRKNIKSIKVDDIITQIVRPSQEVAKDFNHPVEFIFIDGDHDYEMVKLDFDLWFPKVINGGIMAFHDTIGWDGPRRVVSEYIFKSKYFKNANFVDSITYAQKVEHNTLLDRIKNRYVLLVKNFYEFASKLRLAKNIKIIGKKIINCFH